MSIPGRGAGLSQHGRGNSDYCNRGQRYSPQATKRILLAQVGQTWRKSVLRPLAKPQCIPVWTTESSRDINATVRGLWVQAPSGLLRAKHQNDRRGRNDRPILPGQFLRSKSGRVGATVTWTVHSHADRGHTSYRGRSGTGARHENRQDAVRNPARGKPYRRTEIEADWRKSVGLALPPDPRKLKNNSAFSEIGRTL